MSLEIKAQTKITMLDPDFVSVMNNVLKETSVKASETIAVNFRDPKYSAEHGGFHPVEIHVDAGGNILSITDFAYFGMPPMVELGIELDWNFQMNSFRQLDSFYDLECGRSLLGIYTRNFTAYHNGGAYDEVTVTTL